MNIKKRLIFIDSPYSHYFSAIAEKSSKDFDLLFVLSSYGYKVYSGKHPCVYLWDHWELQKEFNMSGVDVPQKILYSGSDKERKHDVIKLYRSLDFLLKTSDTILLYNDLRWHNAVIIQYCKDKSIPYFVFERGVFRPHSTTLDAQGVNANSNLLDNLNLNSIDKKTLEKELEGLSQTRQKHKNINLKFLCFCLLSKISYYKGWALPKGHNSVSLIKYSRIAVKQILTKKTASPPQRSDIVFVALQLPTDTQTLFHSRFEDTQDVINYIESEISDICTLVFKPHPMDYRDYKFQSTSIVSTVNTSRLIDIASSIITVNSTVGFEALCKYKKVITLGESFYTLEPFVTKGNDNLRDKFISVKDIPVDDGAISSFIFHVLYNYQVPGSIFNFTEEDIDFVVDRIKKHGN